MRDPADAVAPHAGSLGLPESPAESAAPLGQSVAPPAAAIPPTLPTLAAVHGPPLLSCPAPRTSPWTCLVFPDRFSSQRLSSQKEFSPRTLSESGPRAAAFSFRFQLKAGQLRLSLTRARILVGTFSFGDRPQIRRCKRRPKTMFSKDRRATPRFQPKPGDYITYGASSVDIRNICLEGV